MKLRKPCQHGKYDAHGMIGFENDAVVVYDRSDCPGGVFLPDDTLIIEKVDGKWPEWFLNAARDDDVALTLDALSVREAEPEVEKNQLGMW